MNLSAVLTKREDEIAEQLALGSVKKEVADALNISVHTVEVTARNIYSKAQVRSVNQLSAWFFCRKFGSSIILSEKKRKLVAFLFLVLFVPYEFTCHQITLRTLRTRIESRSERREDTHDYLFEL